MGQSSERVFEETRLHQTFNLLWRSQCCTQSHRYIPSGLMGVLYVYVGDYLSVSQSD